MSSNSSPGPVPVANVNASILCTIPRALTEVTTMPRQYSVAELEALYQKETAKLALRAQQVQVAKHQDRVKQMIEESGDINAKSSALKVDMEKLSTEYLALKTDYFERESEWQTKLAHIRQELDRARDSDETVALIIALQEEIELATQRPLLLKQQLLSVERLSVLKEKKNEQSKLAQTKDLIADTQSELQLLKGALDVDKKQWHESWGVGDEDKDQEIMRLEAQLEEAIAQKDAAIKKLRTILPLSEAGIAIRVRKIEWAFEGQQDKALLHMGDKASHYGFALADAILVTTRTWSSSRISWYEGLYAFHPRFVIAFQGCTKFLEILDMRAAIANFRKGQLHGTTFESLFLNLIRLSPVVSKCKLTAHQNLPVSITEKTVNFYLNNDENALKLQKDLKEEYERRLSEHKKNLANR